MSRCRGCRREIVWAVTEKGAKMPFDLEAHDDGAFLLTSDPSGNHELLAFHVSKREDVERALGLRAGELEGDPLFVPHHATCPKVEDFRRRRSS